ncbi:Ig-like domain-containing protein [Vulcanisaeta sp. JCM 14467]|uniref:Ig-like domain-containing protein n=1 Tax=Vulcanisaeta sp. JCM 14467 TaxID=1295370 RepID=UPI000A5B551B|nr:Ig-like domain-containing protein [Vulcanisaeta sp. JCM 14467]
MLVNYGVGYHVLTVMFTNTTYFQEAIINYTFFVLPGTVYIIAYVNSTNITYGSAVNIYVKLSPPISGGTLTIGYEINGLTPAITIGSYTPVNGTVQVTWIPPQAGTYVIKIYYTNLPNYQPSSTNLTITVNKAPCSLIITVSGTPEVLHGLIIQSRMTPIIINAQLNVLIKSNTSSISGTMYINSSGIGTYVFTPKIPGNYSIIVSWPGNINYQGCRATYVLNVMKAPLMLYVNGSGNLIAAGGYETFNIGIATDIPINYVSGNLTILIRSGNKTVSMYGVPITGHYIRTSIPFPKPGVYAVLIQYPGNDYVNPGMYGPYYVTVIPGLLGIPWYMLLAYLAPIALGVSIGMIINRKFRQA